MAVEETVLRLAATRAAVTRACGLLEWPSPANLDRCAGVLEKAAADLAEGRGKLREARRNAACLAEAQRLRSAIERAGTLLCKAFEYHARWNRILGAMAGGYTATGDAAPVVRRGRVLVRG